MKHLSIFIVPFLLLIVAISAYVFLSLRINGFVAVTAAARTTAAGLGQQESFQQTIATLLAGTESDRAELAQFVAADSDVVSRIQAIEAAAARDKVAVTIGTVAVADTTWKYHEPLEISLSAKGGFAALAQFATDLESLPEASRLSGMTAEASDKHTWFDTFTIDFVKEKAPPQQTPAS